MAADNRSAHRGKRTRLHLRDPTSLLPGRAERQSFPGGKGERGPRVATYDPHLCREPRFCVGALGQARTAPQYLQVSDLRSGFCHLQRSEAGLAGRLLK